MNWLSNHDIILENGPVVPEISALKQTYRQTLQLFNIDSIANALWQNNFCWDGEYTIYTL